MIDQTVIGYYGLFSNSIDEVVSNLDDSIIIFGSTPKFKEYLLTTIEDGEPEPKVIFHPLSYRQMIVDMDKSYLFALDEMAFNTFRKAASKLGLSISAKQFAEDTEDLKVFAILKKSKKKIILH